MYLHIYTSLSLFSLSHTHLYELQQVLADLVICEALEEAAQSELPHHWVRKITVQQLQSALRLHQGPVPQQTIHLHTHTHSQTQRPDKQNERG